MDDAWFADADGKEKPPANVEAYYSAFTARQGGESLEGTTLNFRVMEQYSGELVRKKLQMQPAELNM